MKQKHDFFYWLITACCIGLAVVFAQNSHLWEALNTKDVTKISWIICGIFTASSLVIGVIAYNKYSTFVTMERLWFISDAMVTLGMIGTVSGFLIMTGDGFNNINVSDTASMQKAMQTVGTGMGTVLVTTLMGLTSSVLLKLQLIIVNHLAVDDVTK
jgi:hypothetical protein